MNKEKRTSVFENGLIWFGTGLSIAEILTGTYLAPLGFRTGLASVLLGHLIGCAILFAAGVIGGRTRKSSMETVKMSFGKWGSLLFVLLNILQLFGWTAVMIYDCSLAAGEILPLGNWVWCLVVGALIVVWILIGLKNLGKVNTVAMAALFVLTLVLCGMILGSRTDVLLSGEAMSFGAAVELSVAMPLSWVPLIGDYTREAEKPVRSAAVSAVVYGLVSCWMYVIGMGSAILTGESDIARIMVKAGLGAAGLIVIVFSTVTTTFPAAYSAGVSSESLPGKRDGKWVAVAVTALGTLCAVLFPLDDITDFLYLIGSVFAPMISIQIADYFILKKDCSARNAAAVNLVIWLVGFVLYRLLMQTDIPVGNTLPDVAVTIVLCLLVNLFTKDRRWPSPPRSATPVAPQSENE